MRWLRRFRDWRGGYAPNSGHMYCYHCMRSMTVERGDIRQMVDQYKQHADDKSHLVQILTWCWTPKLWGPPGYLDMNVEETRYGRGVDDASP